MQTIRFFTLVATACVLSFSAKSIAGPSDGISKGKHGVVRCGGNNFLRLAGAEIQRTNYTFRNYNASVPITIVRMRFFDATGAILFDSQASGFPNSGNGVIGPGDPTLQPNQTAQFSSNDFLPYLTLTQQPLQLEIEWTAPSKVLALDVSLARTNNARDPKTGQIGEERSSHLRECTTIDLK